MTLRVHSARISYGGPDRLDVTRKSGTGGLFLAPSWAILRPAINDRRAGLPFDWARYVEAYIAEMRESYRWYRTEWQELLSRDRVTLVCYCTDPIQCHRHLLRERILPALGAVDAGEVVEQPAQGRLL